MRSPTKTGKNTINGSNIVSTDSVDSAVNLITRKLMKPFEKLFPISEEPGLPGMVEPRNERTNIIKLHRKALGSKSESARNKYTITVRKS